MRTPLPLAAVLLLAPALLPAAEPAKAAAARGALEKATAFMRSIATEGGYLWRYSGDLTVRAGENKATATQVWIQPPGTPSMGMAFLRAYDVTRDNRYLEAARAVGGALVRGQLESGGWDYSIDFDPQKLRQSYLRSDKGKLSDADAARRKNITNFDDNNTQSVVHFLMAYVDTVKGSQDPRDQAIRDALDYALAGMLRAQYPNGAWPQRYDGKPRNAADFPVKRASIPRDYPRTWPGANYNAHYTLNDNSLRDCIGTMIEAHRRFGKPEYLAAAKRGGDFLLLAQLPEPQPVWAQQYNANMEPAWARAFEPPCLTAGESAGAIRALIDLHLETGDDKYLKPIPPALAWYERSKIADNRWARMYELGTNKPIYGDRDGKIYYRLEDISEERRTGYGWQGDYGVRGTVALYDSVKSKGRAAIVESRKPRPLDERQKASRAKSLEPRVDKVLAALDARGRWLTDERVLKGEPARDGVISTQLFIQNLGVLCDYLEAAAR
jgi:PelA/Pel-15E family pectate lyase